MNPKDDPTLFLGGGRGAPQTGFHEEQFLARAPAPVAFPFSRVAHERSPVQKLQHLAAAYGNLLRFTVLLALAARLERESGAAQAAGELSALGPGDLEQWVGVLGRLVEGLPDDALGRALCLFHRTTEIEQTIRMREIVEMRAVESQVGLLTNLCRFQQAQPRKLGDADESNLEQGVRYALGQFREIADAAAPLFAFRLVHLARPDGALPEVRELVGAAESFAPLRRDPPDGLEPEHVGAERPDRPPLDLHPLAVFHTCYECYKENPRADGREIFFYQGHSGRRVHYQGTRHRIATQELAATFQGRLAGLQERAASAPLEPSQAQELLDGLAAAAVERARRAGRYDPELYVTRKAAELQVQRHLCRTGEPLLVLLGECGLGKSALLDQLAARLPRQGHLVLPLDLLGEGFGSDAAPAVERAIGLPLPELLRLAQGILGPNKRVVVLVDHLDRTAAQELFGSFVALAASLEREFPCLRWIVTLRPEFHALLEHEGLLPRAHEAGVLARIPRETLAGRVIERCYRLSPLDRQERDQLYEAASRHERYRVATPLHLLKQAVRGMLSNPDLLLLTLAGYHAREVPPALSVNRLVSRYCRKRIASTPQRERLVAGLVGAMYEKRSEAVSVDDLLDTGEEALVRELTGGGAGGELDGLVRDGVLLRHAAGGGPFGEERLGFARPHLFGYRLAERLTGEQEAPEARAMAALLREPAGRNLAAQPLLFLSLRRAEARDVEWVAEVARQGSSLLVRAVLLQALVHEELRYATRASSTGEPPLGPLAAGLAGEEAGARALLDLADRLYAAGRTDRARAVLEQVRAGPLGEALGVELLLGRLALSSGEHKQAQKLFKRVEKRQRDATPEQDYALQAAQIECLLAAGQGGRAEAAARKLFDKLQVAGARELLVPCRLLLARAAAAGDQPAQAAALFERALETALQAADAEQATAIREAYARHLIDLGDHAGARAQLERLLEEAVREGRALEEALLLERLARLDPPPQRRERLQRAMSRAFGLGSSLELARISLALGQTEQQADRLTQALECFEQAVELGRLFDDEQFQAQALSCLGVGQLARGDFQTALELLGKSLELCKRLQDRPGLAAAYHAIGQIFRATGDGQKALDYYAKSADLHQQLGDQPGAASSWAEMAVLLAARGDDAEAARVLKAAREIHAAAGDARGEARCLWCEGLIEQERGDNARAQACYERARDLQQPAGDRCGLAATYTQMALIHKARGDDYAALKLFDQAALILKARGDRRGLAACYNNLGVIHDARGDFDQALECYEKDLEITRELNDLPGTATSYTNLAILHYNRRNYVRALYYLEQGLAVYKELGDKDALAATEEKIARVKAKM